MIKYPGGTYHTKWFSNAMKPVDSYRLGVYLNMSCDFTESILEKSSMEYFTSNRTYEWLVWCNDYEKAVDKFKEFNFVLSSQFSLVVPGVYLYDVHKVNHTTPLIVTYIGSWANDNFTQLISLRKDNLHGHQLKLSLVLNRLQVNESNLVQRVMDRNLNITDDGIVRIFFVIHYNLLTMFNFTIKVKLADNWGVYDKSIGHFANGMFLDLENKEAHLAFTPAEQLKTRSLVADWAPNVLNFRTCFIFRHPQVFSGYTALLKPLTPVVWLVLAAALCFSVLLLVAISSLKQPDSHGNEPSWSSEVILVLGIMSQQGLSISSERTPKRIVHTFLLLLSITIYGFYGAAIVIFLLSPTPKTINTPDKLIDSQMTLGVEDLTYNRFHFMNISHPMMYKLYHERIKGNTPEEDKFYEINDGLERMRTSYFALYAHDTTMYYLIEKKFSDSEKCLLSEVQPYATFGAAIPFAKQFPYKELFIKGVIRLIESGVCDRERKLWVPARPQCLGQEAMLSVGVGSLTAAYAIFGMGILVSLIILVFEKIASLQVCSRFKLSPLPPLRGTI